MLNVPPSIANAGLAPAAPPADAADTPVSTPPAIVTSVELECVPLAAIFVAKTDDTSYRSGIASESHGTYVGEPIGDVADFGGGDKIEDVDEDFDIAAALRAAYGVVLLHLWVYAH